MIPIGSDERAVLGLDTSAYTTSLAVVVEGRVAYQSRQLLPVPAGRRGLSAQEAVFGHVRQLPRLVATWRQSMPMPRMRMVAASAAPRPQTDSYLPAFVVGAETARLLAHLWDVELFPTTHQEGHIRAGLQSVGQLPEGPFWALHVSGGTTELLEVAPRAGGGYAIRAIGGTDDLYAGQLIDRVGVRLGLPFPAGEALERLAASASETAAIPVPRPRQVGHRWAVSFSGPETAAQRLLDKGADPAAVAHGVERATGRILAGLVKAAVPPGWLLVVGGVAANLTLRAVMQAELAGAAGWQVLFANPDLSRDNAVGVALLGWDRLAASL